MGGFDEGLGAGSVEAGSLGQVDGLVDGEVGLGEISGGVVASGEADEAAELDGGVVLVGDLGAEGLEELAGVGVFAAEGGQVGLGEADAPLSVSVVEDLVEPGGLVEEVFCFLKGALEEDDLGQELQALCLEGGVVALACVVDGLVEGVLGGAKFGDFDKESALLEAEGRGELGVHMGVAGEAGFGAAQKIKGLGSSLFGFGLASGS